MRYFSTFSGVGGFELGIQYAYEKRNRELGIERAWSRITEQGQREGVGATQRQRSECADKRTDGLTCIGYSEIDKYATQIYQKHFPNHKAYGDITKMQWKELPEFDLLVGGFPCQSFSIAGKRKGFQDTRGTLFFDIAKGLQIKQPNFALLENVKGLISHDKGKTLETILESLQELGYYVNIEVYNSKDFGVPQNRERIFFICRHIKTLIKDGDNLNLHISRKIISEYLFQILLNNLVEVKKLQDQKSKDWVIGYLLSKEINQSIPNLDTKESIKDGISIPTAENKSLFQEGGVWQNIATWLNNKWEEDSHEKNKSTTSTALKQIIESKTYTFLEMQKAILLATVLLRNYYPNLWQEVLSDLIVIKESTKYARINDKKEEVVITETGNAYLTKDIQANEQFIAFANLRGTPRPEVFPFCEDGEAVDELSGHVSNTLTRRYEGAQAVGTYIGEGELNAQEIHQINQPIHSNDRIYGADGISPTINTMQGGNRQPFVAEQSSIRRLTPTECARLQGFPDDWHKVEGISDTQAYKCYGNAVTVNVIQDVVERMIQ